MSAFAHITHADDRKARREEAIAWEGHKMARYAMARYAMDAFAQLAWCWVTAGRDAGDERDHHAIRDAAITEILSRSTTEVKRLWQGFMDTGLIGTDSAAAIMQWRHGRAQKAVA